MQPHAHQGSPYNIPLITVAITSGLIAAMPLPFAILKVVDDLPVDPGVMMCAALLALLLGGWGTAAAIRNRRLFRSRFAAAGCIAINVLPILLGLAPIVAIATVVILQPPMFGSDSERLLESPHPLTIAEARAMGVDFAFPESAYDITFRFYYTGWIGYEETLSFRATPEDCRATAERLLAEWNTNLPEGSRFELREEDGSLTGGGSGHGKPALYVHLEAGVFEMTNSD